MTDRYRLEAIGELEHDAAYSAANADVSLVYSLSLHTWIGVRIGGTQTAGRYQFGALTVDVDPSYTPAAKDLVLCYSRAERRMVLRRRGS